MELITDDQALDLLHALQRPGTALPTDRASTWSRLLASIAPEFARALNAAASLPEELDPFTTHELLPKFEASLLLPGCIPLESSEELRKQAVLHLLRRANRNLTAQHIVDTAAAFGFVIQINEFGDPSECGDAVCGDTLTPESVNYFFEVVSDEFEEVEAFCGATVCGDPLGSIAGDELQCLINELKPFHKTPVYVTAP